LYVPVIRPSTLGMLRDDDGFLSQIRALDCPADGCRLSGNGLFLRFSEVERDEKRLKKKTKPKDVLASRPLYKRIFSDVSMRVSVALFLLLVLTLPNPGRAAWGDNHWRISELQRKTSDIRSRVAEMRRKKYEKMRAAREMIQSISVNQQRLEQERHSLDLHQQRLDETRDKITYLEQRLDGVTGNAMRLGKVASSRLRALYMGERLSLLSMILEANNLATLLDRIYYKQRIVGQDKQLLTDLRLKIEELNSLKGQLATQKFTLGRSISTIRVKNMQIERTIEVDNQLRQKYQKDAAFYDRAESELLQESAGITAQIRALSSQHSFQVVRNSTGVFMWPIHGRINSGFGYRFHPIHHRTIMHTGLDIGGPNHGAIHAADGGQVIWAGWKGGYGKAIMLNHGNRGGRNLVTLYGHLSSINVSAGQSVSKGQLIGLEGSTGYSTGPHLHFEVRVNGAPTNPLNYL
jgi:murein DD-endopeptidase MepM/ murein hydrolase activator NlpD